MCRSQQPIINQPIHKQNPKCSGDYELSIASVENKDGATIVVATCDSLVCLRHFKLFQMKEGLVLKISYFYTK